MKKKIKKNLVKSKQKNILKIDKKEYKIRMH